jgi:hypothetical protein
MSPKKAKTSKKSMKKTKASEKTKKTKTTTRFQFKTTALKKLGGAPLTMPAAASSSAGQQFIVVGIGAEPGTSIVCFFNENTGNFDRCRTVRNSEIGIG